MLSCIRKFAICILSQGREYIRECVKLCEISFSSSARNLGFYFRDDMSVELHVKNVCFSAYSELCRISTVQHLLSVDSTKTLVSASVRSRLDYCNLLLSGCPKQLLEK